MPMPTMKRTDPMPHAALLIALVALLALTACADAGSARLEPGKNTRLHVTAGDYRVTFVARSAWTIREAAWKDDLFLTPTGAYGTVARWREKPPEADLFVGTGHGGEKVESLTLAVYENDADDPAKTVDVLEAVENGKALPAAGARFVLTKTSRIGPYKHTFVTTVSPEGLRETSRLEPDGDLDTIDLVYPFMHCFPKSYTDWTAALPGGGTDGGTFASDNRFTLRKAAEWIAVYDAEKGRGVLLAFPGEVSAPNKLWNRKRDNKLYLTYTGKRLTDPPEVTIAVRVFEADKDGWKEKAGKEAAGIVERER
jgi:hypothetical protein